MGADGSNQRRVSAKFVCAFDEAGTMVEIVPAGIEYVPGPGNRTDMVVGAHVERTPVHGSFTTPLDHRRGAGDRRA